MAEHQVRWAVFVFDAEADDELPLRIGERVEVIERDDAFQDGWWKGRNEAGKVGLFPESYTTAQPPQNSQQVPQNHLKPHSIASKLSEESSQGAASVKTGGFMSTNLSTALQDPTQSRLSSSVPATAHLNQHSDDDNARERKFSDATVESLDKGQSPIQPLSKSMNWADRAAARSELAARAKAQIEKAAQEKLARQQQQKQMYENLFSANSSVGLPHEGLEFSDESDEEQQFGARLVSAHSREASKSGAELPRASTPTNLDNPTYAHFSENSYPSNSSTMPGGLQDSPIDARGARAPPQDDNSTQQLPQLAPDDQSRELGFSNTPEPSAPPQEDIPDPSSTPIIRHEPSDSSELDADNRNSTGYTQSNSHNREHEATETLGSQPNTDMLRPDVTSCSASYMSDFSDNSTTHGMAAQFPDPPAESASTEESATHLNPPATETTPAARSSPNHLSPDLPQDLTFSAPARYQSPTLSAEQPTPLMSSDITPQPSQQSLAAKPETPVTDYNRSRPTSASQLEESSHHQSTSVRTEDTSPRSSLASKTAAPTDPRTWTVEQVVEWGRSKGFDATTLDKFTEHEISGDVLVEMDVNTLKEIDLHAFGRRVHINKGIKELRKMFEPPPAPPSSSQNAAYPSSASLTSPSLMSGYEPDSSSTPGMTSFPSANFRDSVNSSQNGQYALSQPGEHSQGASVDNQGHYRVHQKSAPSAPYGRSNRDGSRTLSSSTHQPLPEEDEETHTQGREMLSDSELTQNGKRNKRLNRLSQNASSPSLAPSANSNRASSRKSDADTKRSSWLQVEGDIFNTSKKLPGSQLFHAGRKARKPPPPAPSVLSESLSGASTSSKPKSGRMSLANVRQSTRLFGLGSSNNESEPKTTPRAAHRRVPPPPALERSHSQERAYDWEDQEEGPSVMGAPDPLAKIGNPDLDGMLRKRGKNFNTWKTRYVLVKGIHLYIMKTPKEHKIKGWVPLQGYKVLPDPDTLRGSYGFKLTHPQLPPHYFASDDMLLVRKFMKILMKGSIQRDWNADTFSSSQVATISLQDAQAMNPPPRPPSPNSRSTIQRASRIAGDTNSLSARDAQLLMQNAKPVPTSPQPHGPKPSMSVSIPASTASPASAGSGSGSRSSRFSFFKNATLSRSASTLFGAGAQTSAISSGASSSATSPQEVLSSQLLSVQENRLSEDKAVGLEEATKNAPRITTPKSSHTAMLPDISGTDESSTDELLKWVNAQLPDSVSKATSFTNSFRSGEVIYNLIKSCSGTSKAELEVPSRFNNVSMDHVDVIFDLFDYMLEQQIDTREVSMAELLQGHEDQTRNLVDSINSKYA